MGDPAITPDSDPHELVGQDIQIVYRLRVQKVIRLRFTTVLKGILPNGQHFNVSLDDKDIYAIKTRSLRRGWWRWPRRG